MEENPEVVLLCIFCSVSLEVGSLRGQMGEGLLRSLGHKQHIFFSLPLVCSHPLNLYEQWAFEWNLLFPLQFFPAGSTAHFSTCKFHPSDFSYAFDFLSLPRISLFVHKLTHKIKCEKLFLTLCVFEYSDMWIRSEKSEKISLSGPFITEDNFHLLLVPCVVIGSATSEKSGRYHWIVSFEGTLGISSVLYSNMLISAVSQIFEWGDKCCWERMNAHPLLMLFPKVWIRGKISGPCVTSDWAAWSREDL